MTKKWLIEIRTVVKEAKQDIMFLGKLKKKKLKQLKKMGQSRDIPTQQLLDTFQVYYDARLDMQEKLIDHRLRIQDLLKKDELEQILEPAVLTSEKARKKIEKAEDKDDQKVEKIIGDGEKEIEGQIEDKQR